MEKLNLKGNKGRMLKVFLDNFPYMLVDTCTCDRIIPGFIDVGMIDAKHKFLPDFYAILKTKRRSITRSEMQIIKKCFSQLFGIMLETGYIPEKFYYALGFPKDEVRGFICNRNDGIEKEWMQRSKLITHWFQKKLGCQYKIKYKIKY